MRVDILKADQSGSGFYRVDEPARVARALGVEVEVLVEAKVDGWQENGFAYVKDVQHDCDILVFQRPLSQQIHAVAVQAKKQGIRIVVELDDDFHSVHGRNVAHDAVDPQKNPLHNREWLAKTCALADLLTVSTPRLAKYGPDRAVVVRNRLPMAALATTASPDVRYTIGWTGTVKSHPEDMQATRGGLGSVDAPVAIVGDAEGVAASSSIPTDRVTLASPWKPSVPEYWGAVAEAFGIGIAPLQTSKFNVSKSWLKPLEYLSWGIPFVCSHTPEYELIVKLTGAGVLAASAGQWARHLNALLNNDTMFQRMRDNGLQWAHLNVLELHAQDWATAWEKAL